jgi:hypothetical protein
MGGAATADQDAALAFDGNSSVTTTEIYAHLAPNEVSEEAVEVLNRLQANPTEEIP